MMYPSLGQQSSVMRLSSDPKERMIRGLRWQASVLRLVGDTVGRWIQYSRQVSLMSLVMIHRNGESKLQTGVLDDAP
jgi:hypothetical protein